MHGNICFFCTPSLIVFKQEISQLNGINNPYTAVTPPGQELSEGKKVLIIEDNLDIRENIVEILELSGYWVYAADNGEMGIALALQNLPHITLCDIMMPELDGVLSQLNKLPQMKTVPFLFLTAKSEDLELRRGMALEAKGYLVKPFDDMVLINAIESQLNRKLTGIIVAHDRPHGCKFAWD